MKKTILSTFALIGIGALALMVAHRRKVAQ